MPGEYHWQGSQTRYRSQRVRHDWRDLARIYSPESVMPSNHRILYHPFILFPSIFPSLGVFSRVGSLHHVAQYGSFIFSISPPNEYSGLVSFWIDWFHLFAVQGILKSLLQHHSSKASVLWCSAFFMIQLSEMQYLDAISKMTQWSLFISKANHSISR